MYQDFRNRLQKRKKHLVRWAKRRDIEAWRLYDRDIPNYPFLIDCYKDAMHFQVYYDEEKAESPAYDLFLDACLHIAQEILEVDDQKTYFKIRKPQKDGFQYEKLSARGHDFTIREGAAQFYVNLENYLDTGLFLDHRLLRRRVAEMAKGKSVLNLFSYTASFSVHAAVGGAKSTLSIDLSKTATQRARENFRLNGIDAPEHRCLEADVFAFIEDALYATDRYDIIILDPPSFSNSKSMYRTLDIRRDAEELIEKCATLLTQDGVLFFSTNKRNFKLGVLDLPYFRVREITHLTIDEDFKARPPHKAWEIQRV